MKLKSRPRHVVTRRQPTKFPGSRLFQECGYSERERRRTADTWLELAIQAADLGAWVWDLKTSTPKIVRNEQYNKLFGIKSSSTWTRDDWLKAIHPEDRSVTHHQMESIISGRMNEYDAKYRIIRPDRTIAWAHAKGSNIRNSRGKVIRVTGVIGDITEHKRVEQDRDHLVAALSHDLRNPLAAVRTNAELMQRFPDRTRHEELLKKIVSNVERADRMIQDLLDSSRIHAGHPLNVRLEPCDLTEVVEAVAKDLAGLHSRRVESHSSGHFMGMWDKEGVRRILENLVGNAIKYGEESTPVTIGLDRTDHSVSITVHNVGNPIPTEFQKSLFEPFQREKFTSGEKRGWGIGLMVVRGLAEAYGGHVDVNSTREEGTIFTVTLPQKTM